MESLPVPEPSTDIKKEVVETIEKAVDSADKKVDEAAETVGEKIDEVIKPVDEVIQKAPEVVAVVQEVMEGRSCSIPCWLWICSLRITRRTPPTARAKSEAKASTASK